jgi:hypothetical protein
VFSEEHFITGPAVHFAKYGLIYTYVAVKKETEVS